jgi:tetratricopeptide (TPR) repeat protein
VKKSITLTTEAPRHREEVPFSRSATSLNPNNSQAYFKLGALYLSQGRWAKAMREYQEGLKSDPENRDALAAVGKLSSRVRAQ